MAWELAWRAVEQFQRKPAKVDGIPVAWEHEDEVERRRAQRLFFGFLRWRSAVDQALQPWLKKRPRPRLEALLLLAGFELCAAQEATRPAIVHFATGLAKTRLTLPESRLVNAVLRRFTEAIADHPLSVESAHPAWLVARWKRHFGGEAAAVLMAWNQEEPPIYACWEGDNAPPAEWRPTAWAGYFDVSACPWLLLRPLLDAQKAYVQDPFARHPVQMIAPRDREVILDACAAPGGKSRGLLRAWDGRGGKLIAVDLPGPRFERLKQNLEGVHPKVQVSLQAADLVELDPNFLKRVECPDGFDGVLIDAPCSNTGVIARRPDVRHLLNPKQLEALPLTQVAILRALAPLVKEQGRLVYSTCSLEPEENEEVIQAFLSEHPDFSLIESRFSRPWLDRHDGGAAFLLVRRQPDLG